jgi:hypothetical protein
VTPGITAMKLCIDSHWLASSLCLILLLLTHESVANDRMLFEIPQMQADLALKELSRQSGYPVIFRTSEVETTQTSSLMGLYSMREALTRMFEGTQLQGSLSGEKVLTVTLTTFGVH